MPFQQALRSRLCAPVPPPAPPAPPAPLPRSWPCSRLRPHRRGPSGLRLPEMSSQALLHGLGSAQAVPPVCRFGIASSRGAERWGRQREGPSVLLPLGRAVLGQTGPGEQGRGGLCTVRGLLLGGTGAVALSRTLGPLLCPLGSYVLVPCARGILEMQRGWQHLTTCFACTLLEPCRVVRASPGPQPFPGSDARRRGGTQLSHAHSGVGSAGAAVGSAEPHADPCRSLVRARHRHQGTEGIWALPPITGQLPEGSGAGAETPWGRAGAAAPRGCPQSSTGRRQRVCRWRKDASPGNQKASAPWKLLVTGSAYKARSIPGCVSGAGIHSPP